MLKRLTKLVLSLSAFFSLHAEANTENLQHFLSRWQKTYQVSGVSLGIKREGQEPQYFQRGTTTQHGKIKISENTLFGVGSITKTFVSATLLQLQEEHRINLDDPIAPYFPEYPRWGNITIRQLLNMTSGIPNFTQLKAFQKLSSPEELASYHPASFFTDLAYQAKDHFTPGSAWEYSNTNYYLLGMIIQKITRDSLENEFKKRFFEPLHLKHTYYSDSAYSKTVKQESAHPYHDGEDFIDRNPSHYGAAGSMLMNIADLMTWTQDLFTPGKVLSEASLKQLMTTIPMPFTPPKPKGARYGLGVYSLNLPREGLVWWYAGVTQGYSSVFVWIPSKKTVVAAQINGWNKNQFWLLFPTRGFLNTIFKSLH